MSTNILETDKIVETVQEWLKGTGVTVKKDNAQSQLLVLSLEGKDGSPVQKMAKRHGIDNRLQIKWHLPIREGNACSVTVWERDGKNKTWTFPSLFRMKAFDDAYNPKKRDEENDEKKSEEKKNIHPLDLCPDIDGGIVISAWWRDVQIVWKRFARKIMELESSKSALTPHDFAKLEARLNAPVVSSRARRELRCFEDESSGSETNPLRALEDRRNVLIDWPSETLGRLRVPHGSHKRRLCPFQTPESKRIGLSLYLTADAKILPNGKIDEGKDLLSAAVGLIPYPTHTDGPRLMMGGKNMKQAEIGIANPEPPFVPGYYEGKAAESQPEGWALDGHLKRDEGKNIRFTPCLGLNALTVIMPFKGYTYEDGLVISESLADRLFIKNGHYSYSKIMKDVVFAKEELEARGLTIKTALEEYFRKRLDTLDSPNCTVRVNCTSSLVEGDTPDGDSEDALKGPHFVYGDRLLPNESDKDGHCLKLYFGNGLDEEIKIVDIYAHHAPGVLQEIDIKYQITGRDRWNVPHLDLTITWTFSVKRPMGMGDKLTGRNGNKGVVTKVLPDEDMPEIHFKEGGKERIERAELIISPSSIMGRKNLGQIWEMTHSLLIKLGGEALRNHLKKEFMLDIWNEPIDVLTWERIQSILMDKFGADARGTFEVTGKEDIPKGTRAFAGWQYFCRLHHHAWKKLQARGSDAPRDWVTGQPMTCGARTGQRMGEMENWSLLSHGAMDVLMAMREKQTGDFTKTEDFFSAVLLSLGIFPVPFVYEEGKVGKVGIEFFHRDKDKDNKAEAMSLQSILDMDYGKRYPAYRACWYLTSTEKKELSSLYQEARNQLAEYLLSWVNWGEEKKENKELSDNIADKTDKTIKPEKLSALDKAKKFNEKLDSLFQSFLDELDRFEKKDASLETLRKFVKRSLHIIKASKLFDAEDGTLHIEMLRKLMVRLQDFSSTDDTLGKKLPEFKEQLQVLMPRFFATNDAQHIKMLKKFEKQVRAILKTKGFFDDEGALHVETRLLDCNPELKKGLWAFYKGKDPHSRLQGLLRYHDELIEMLSGKTGIPRRFLLGRRYDRSGRAVIVPEPSLAPNEVYLPIAMLVELLDGYDEEYRQELDEDLRNTTELRTVVNDIPERRDKAGDIPRKMDSHLMKHPLWAFLVRQPSLHRHSIQAFRLRCWEHPVIGMPPLVTSGFNADFDGDTMAVFLPPYEQAKDLSRFSILNNPGIVGTGKPAFADGLDLALGWWNLKKKKRKEWYDELGTKMPENKEKFSIYLPKLLQTIGSLLLDEQGQKLHTLQQDICRASTGATTLAPGDFETLCKALEVVSQQETKKGDAEAELKKALEANSGNGLALMLASGAKGKFDDVLQMVWAIGKIEKMRDDIPSPDMGEDASAKQVSIAGWEGDTAGQEPDIEETESAEQAHVTVEDAPSDQPPATAEEGAARQESDMEEVFINGNFWRGLDEDELFTYSYPSRYSMAQKKLSVAEAGYLSRQLAEGLYELTVSGEDCGTTEGLRVAYDPKTSRLTIQGETLPTLGDLTKDLERIAWGRVPLGSDFFCLNTKHLKFIKSYWINQNKAPDSTKNHELKKLLKHLNAHGGTLVLRSPLFCKHGKKGHVCGKCCGADLAAKPYDRPKPIDEGYAAGLTAAQAIGERGTQLAMKRFHDVSSVSQSPIQAMRRLLVYGKVEERTAQELLQELFAKVLSSDGGSKANGELPQSLIHYELALMQQLHGKGRLDAVAKVKENRFLSALAHESAEKVIQFKKSEEDTLSTIKSRLMWKGGKSDARASKRSGPGADA